MVSADLDDNVNPPAWLPDSHQEWIHQIADQQRAQLTLPQHSTADHAAIDDAETLSATQQERAAALAPIPQEVRELCEESEALPVAMPALLLFPAADRELLEASTFKRYRAPIESLWEVLNWIDAGQRVALIDNALRTLSTVPAIQSEQVLAILRELTSAAGDGHWQLQSWCCLAEEAVSPAPPPRRPKHPKLRKLLRETIELVSVAAVAAEDGSLADYRFQRGWGLLDLPPACVLPADVLAFADLEAALAKVAMTPATLRAIVCDACTFALTTDGTVDATQAALFRLIRQRLGFPPLPVLPGQRLNR